MKKCTKCSLLKDENEFSKYKNSKDGLCSWCKSCFKEYMKEYWINPKVIEHQKEYNANPENKKRKKKYDKERQKKYLSILKNKEHRREYERNKNKTDINFKLAKLFRNRLRASLKSQNVKKTSHTLDDLGCDIEFVKFYLQMSAVLNGYEDFNIDYIDGKKYHIDHIIPVSSFNLINEDERKECFNWTNLQILTKQENLEKSDKILIN